MITPSSSLDLCLVMRQFYPVLAGAAERCRRYAPGLLARGVSMTAVARQNEVTQNTDEMLDCGVRVLRVAAEPDVHTWDQALLRQAVTQLRGRESRSILQTNMAFEHTRSLLLQIRRSGVPTVWLGSMMEDLATGRSWWQNLRERLHLRTALSGFDACAVGSTAMRDWLHSAWVPAHRIEVIGHGVDQTRFRPAETAAEKTELLKKFDLPADSVITLMVGTITARKGVHLLLEAWEKQLACIPNTLLVIAGAFDRPTVVHESQQRDLAAYQQGVRSQLERLNECGRVRHLGEVPSIHELMRAADLLVLPSDREGVPNVVLEAMSSGLPCVLAPFVGLPREELGIEGKTWLLSERSVNGLSATILPLLRDAEMRREVGNAAFVHARGSFALDKTLDAYAGLYHRLVQG